MAQKDRKAMVTKIRSAITCNVDRWYGDRISHPQFCRNQRRLWTLAARFGVDDALAYRIGRDIARSR